MIWIMILCFLGLFVFCLARYSANLILTPEPYSLQPEFKILDVQQDSEDIFFVTLPPPPSKRQFSDTKREGVYNLLYEKGYGRLGNVTVDASGNILRTFDHSFGELPKAGDDARMDHVIYRSDPRQAHKLDFENLTLQGEEDKLNAWWLPQSDTAVLMLHGRRRADRTETLRILPTLYDAGYSVMALCKRYAKSTPWVLPRKPCSAS